MGNDSLAQIAPTETAVGRPTSATARRLVNASVSANTRRAYAGALRQLDAWLAGQKLDDAALAAYLAELHDAGRAASSAAMVVAAASFRARLAGTTSPVGTATARVLAGYRRTTADRGRGQARAFSADDLASELTARGASTTAVMLAGNWKSSRMVAHYSAGATAERGAVARYL